MKQQTYYQYRQMKTKKGSIAEKNGVIYSPNLDTLTLNARRSYFMHRGITNPFDERRCIYCRRKTSTKIGPIKKTFKW